MIKNQFFIMAKANHHLQNMQNARCSYIPKGLTPRITLTAYKQNPQLISDVQTTLKECGNRIIRRFINHFNDFIEEAKTIITTMDQLVSLELGEAPKNAPLLSRWKAALTAAKEHRASEASKLATQCKTPRPEDLHEEDDNLNDEEPVDVATTSEKPQ